MVFNNPSAALAGCAQSGGHHPAWHRADVICGGFPCQDISFAGKGAALAGARSGLWRLMCGAIRLVRPKYALVENVAALRQRGLGTVLGDLAESGYDAEWDCLPAFAVGAPHRRDRLWLVAYPHHQRRQGGGPQAVFRQPALQGQLARVPSHVIRRSDLPTPQLSGVDDAIPRRLDRIRGLGNAVVPQIPELIGKAILEHYAAIPKD